MRAFAVVALITLSAQALAQPVSTSFTFQGVVTDGGTPANATYDMQFRLYDASSGGSQVGPTLCSDNLAVAGGTFAVQLDFGSAAFTGSKRFIEMSIRPDAGLDCTASTGFTSLAPRQEVTATPYAQHALGAATASVATTALSASTFGGQPSSFYTNAGNIASGTLADTRLSVNIPRANTTNAFAARQSITSSLSTDPEALLVTLNNNNTSQAIKGVATGGSATVHGGLFEASNSPAGVGVLGQALANSGATRGVWGKVNSASGWAGYFEGRGYFSGNVGIGTGMTAPLAPLHVHEGSAGAPVSANASAVFERSSTNYLQVLSPDANERGVAFGSPVSGFHGGVYYTNASGLTLRTGGNTTRVRVSEVGDVGIGVATPGARLHVGGDLRVDGGIAIPVTTRYLSIPGTAFIPQNTDNTSITSITDGMIRGSSLVAQSLLQATAPVYLPDGATITSFTLYTIDNHATMGASAGLSFRPWTSDSGTILRSISTPSGANPALQQVVGTLTTPHTVDNASNCYWIWLQWGQVDTVNLVEIYGVRVTYTVNTVTP